MNADVAANRLHHLSMRYAGALVELIAQAPITALATGHPGLREARDFIDLILFTRAEINGLTKILVDAKLVTPERVSEIMAEQYEWLTKEKAKFLNVGVSDEGLVLNGANGN